VLRGDHGRIEVGARTSVQDGTVVHCTHDWPTLIGAECVVGHNAHLEGCVVGDRCLIGSGSITLNGVTVGTGAIVAAASLVPEGFEVPPGALVAGVPARIKRTGVSPGFAEKAVKTYIETARAHRAGLRRLDRP
jgi:carbonic anhydrase/acetyltransferase-like protein (isoleucine patch superfamily)